MESIRYAVFGAGEFGYYINNIIQETSHDKVSFFVDHRIIKDTTIPVISPIEAMWRFHNGEFDRLVVAVKNYYSIEDILLELHEIGFETVLIADPKIWELSSDIKFYPGNNDLFYKLDIKDKAVITKLEFHVCDHCNLNCRGCSHFAPIYNETYADLMQFKKDVERLSGLFSNIFRFRLMGGEPFLNLGLSDFVSVARRFFPHANIEIVTNGLILDRVDDSIWEVIKKQKAILNISLYPPTFRIRDSLETILNKKGIMYRFGSGLEQYNDEGIIEEFHKNLTNNNLHSQYISASRCMGRRCHYLRNGKIAKCAIPLLAPDLNKKFDRCYDVKPDDYVDIYQDVPPWDIMKKLYYSTPFCSYCSDTGTERFRWEVSRGKSEISDYIIEEEA